MSVLDLLSRLDKVRKTGPASWVACCPAHQDKRPSMSVAEADDGRVLVHCFASCSVEEILGAVGLGFDAIFPERTEPHKPVRRPFPAADVLENIVTEATLVAAAACNIRQGITLSLEDHKRLLVAAERIHAARELVNG